MAPRKSEVADAFPEVAENLWHIENVRQSRMELTRRLGANDVSTIHQPYDHRSGSPGLLDPRVGTADLSRDNVDARMDTYGGRGHQASVAGLIRLHREEMMPLPHDFMPSKARNKMAEELTEMEKAKLAAWRAGGGGSIADSPFLDPAFGRRGQSRAARSEFSRGQHAMSERLATAEQKGRVATASRRGLASAPDEVERTPKKRAPKEGPRWGSLLLLLAAHFFYVDWRRTQHPKP